MRVAIVHYWLVTMRGGEKVLETLCEMYPEADIYTHVYNPAIQSSIIKKHTIFTTFISKLPWAKKLYQCYLPLMPFALEQLDLTEYDLVISCESGPAKGIICAPDALHVCYCHSPMRYIWDMSFTYLKKAGFIKRFFAFFFFHRLRMWDRTSALAPKVIIANSSFIAKRIQQFWNRESIVIHPPVAVQESLPTQPEREDYYIYLGELIEYKMIELVVETFNQPNSNRKLLILGDGSLRKKLEQRCSNNANIQFLGRVDEQTKNHHLSHCKALIFPSLEDFGIVPVEALAVGTPVIAYARGGVLDIIEDNTTGVLFKKQTTASLTEALNTFETNIHTFLPTILHASALRFKSSIFKEKIQAIVAKNT